MAPILLGEKKAVPFQHIRPQPGSTVPANAVGYILVGPNGPEVSCFGGIPAELEIASRILAHAGGAFLLSEQWEEEGAQAQVEQLAHNAIMMARVLMGTHQGFLEADAAARKAAEAKR